MRKAIGQGEYLGYKFLIYCEGSGNDKIFTGLVALVKEKWDKGDGPIGGFDNLPQMHLHVLGYIRSRFCNEEFLHKELLEEQILEDGYNHL